MGGVIFLYNGHWNGLEALVPFGETTPNNYEKGSIFQRSTGYAILRLLRPHGLRQVPQSRILLTKYQTRHGEVDQTMAASLKSGGARACSSHESRKQLADAIAQSFPPNFHGFLPQPRRDYLTSYCIHRDHVDLRSHRLSAIHSDQRRSPTLGHVTMTTKEHITSGLISFTPVASYCDTISS